MVSRRPSSPTDAGGPLLDRLSPMLLAERKVPPADQSAYIAEVKYDGYRVLAEFGNNHCVLKSKNGADASAWFPE